MRGALRGRRRRAARSASCGSQRRAPCSRGSARGSCPRASPVGRGLERAPHAVEVERAAAPRSRGRARSMSSPTPREVGLGRLQARVAAAVRGSATRLRPCVDQPPSGELVEAGPSTTCSGWSTRELERPRGRPGPGNERTSRPSSAIRNSEQRQHEVAEDLSSIAGRGGAAMRFTTGSILVRPSAGRTRKTNFCSSTPSSLKNAATVCASGAAAAPLAARTRSRMRPGALLAVLAGHLARGDRRPGSRRAAASSRRTSSTVLRIECARRSQPGGTSCPPVLGVGVEDGVGDQHDRNSVPARVALRRARAP